MELLDAHKWQRKDTEAGTLWWLPALAAMQPSDLDLSNPVEWAKRQPGSWVAVLDRGSDALILTDVSCRSTVLFARDPLAGPDESCPWLIATSPEPITARLPEVKLHRDAAAEFRHTGFVIGPDTLIDGVQGAGAAQVITLCAQGYEVDYSIDRSAAIPSSLSPTAYLDEFKKELFTAISATVEAAGGHQLLIPLSGGADSRLLLAILRELDAPNVLTFTYGVPGSREVGISKSVAEALHFDWELVKIDPENMRQRWYRDDTVDFLRSSWVGRSLPHIQDWYALTELVKNPKVDPRAVVLAGHTIVGNFHDHHEGSFDANLRRTRTEVARSIIHHHFILQGEPTYGERVAYSREKINDFLLRWWADEDPHTRHFITSGFNVAERQAKYINNSMRAYEHFGFQWALPMIDRNVVDMWATIPYEIVDPQRREYVQWTNEYYARVSGTEVTYFLPPAQTLPAPGVRLAKSLLTRTGLLEKAQLLYSSSVNMRHPMGYQALRGPLSMATYGRELLSGRHVLGIFADLFLANEWVPGSDIVPVTD